ncbi:hypothetical protein KXW91_001280 [Aspergillus fumigatus]|nr:hypothetical protein KXX15_008639 [Aspergillus fumigatus]KAH2358011.1 hypothetical protein KXW91_001280 [Aspergillus fumigatus]KAH2464183.1 hypothetical protein KXW63_007059 [Aspergillus fumigatus]KAH2586852.1 hypothetical protein KXV99_009100 [Aspergillus fumigatus]KAH2712762.1 hypothetical protein KXW03_005848 [Aspergillus fumigatus]
MYAVPAVDIKDILGYKPSAQCAIFMEDMISSQIAGVLSGWRSRRQREALKATGHSQALGDV